MSTFHTICLACMVIGIIIPFLSIVLNLFDGFADFISIDLLQLDFGGDFYLDFLPFSVNSICLGALLFGGFGFLFENKLPFPVLIVIGLVIAYIAAVILQSAVGRLKRIENFAADKNEILMREGIVSNTIPNGGVGAVSIKISTGSNVSYPAKAYDGKEIRQDKKVKIVQFDGDYVIVQSSTYLEDKYDA
ncbi:MAG: hypothetical protein Q4F11_08295 [Eubacteriales bacterium]|nr:hypothetical protein [Eubacteriales bacterium]